MKSPYIIMALVLVFGIGILASRVNNSPMEEIVNNSPTPTEVVSQDTKFENIPTNFVKEGNWSEGFLVYEEPGKPALRKRLMITDISKCGEEVCQKEYENGTRMKVEGVLDGESVDVIRLTIIK